MKPTHRTVTACSAQYRPPYEYQCTAGHHLGADRPVSSCPVYVAAAPCPGQLRRVGVGSKAAAR